MRFEPTIAAAVALLEDAKRDLRPVEGEVPSIVSQRASQRMSVAIALLEEIQFEVDTGR